MSRTSTSMSFHPQSSLARRCERPHDGHALKKNLHPLQSDGALLTHACDFRRPTSQLVARRRDLQHLVYQVVSPFADAFQAPKPASKLHQLGIPSIKDTL